MQHNFDITNNGEIVDALIKGDEATFAMVYKSYFISLRNYATSILSDQEAAYEIVQNLLVNGCVFNEISKPVFSILP